MTIKHMIFSEKKHKLIQCSLYYKATPSAKIVWPYTAGGLSLEVNLNRKYSPVSLRGGLIIEGGLWSEGPYNAGSTVIPFN